MRSPVEQNSLSNSAASLSDHCSMLAVGLRRSIARMDSATKFSLSVLFNPGTGTRTQ